MYSLPSAPSLLPVFLSLPPAAVHVTIAQFLSTAGAALLCICCMEASLPDQLMLAHLPWLTASRQSSGASRAAHSPLETSPLIPINQDQGFTSNIRHFQVELLMCCVILFSLKWKIFPTSPTLLLLSCCPGLHHHIIIHTHFHLLLLQRPSSWPALGFPSLQVEK